MATLEVVPRAKAGRKPIDRLSRVKDPHVRALYLTALLTKEMGPGSSPPILVGGAAVSFYLAGGYVSGDVDLVTPARKEVDRVLRGWGFRREGRHWFHPTVALYVEVPDDTLAGDPTRVLEAEVMGQTARVIGVEDLIADRVAASVHWSSKESGRQAMELMAIHDRRIDWPYLAARVREYDGREMVQALRRLRSEAKRTRGTRRLP
jgi:hypothetical protein